MAQKTPHGQVKNAFDQLRTAHTRYWEDAALLRRAADPSWRNIVRIAQAVAEDLRKWSSVAGSDEEFPDVSDSESMASLADQVVKYPEMFRCDPRYQVRKTLQEQQPLIIHPAESREKIFVLNINLCRPTPQQEEGVVAASFFRFRIAGWISGRDGQCDDYRQMVAGRPVFAIPPEVLRPMKELPEPRAS